MSFHFDEATFRNQCEQGAHKLLAIQTRALAEKIQCVVYVDSADTPKLYAYAAIGTPAGTRALGHGPHEIVCIGQGQMDLWRSPDGKSPQMVRANISDDEAIKILVKDYQQLLERLLRELGEQ